ncbi:restriction endonuclease subunit S [Thomasclavelia cocleata]|uniref:restriction endonuclease subunit S n=1 Tax=Thomasclavelia cocleata TaxID=69824 RepID=UPI00242F95DE|nr:restriction endonuclease subunit S [Thomasclavelia cocleata]
MRVKLKDITNYSKGSQVNSDCLIENGKYIYLNGGVNPSGKWNNYNVLSNTVTVSEGGNSSGYINYITEPFWCGAHCYYLFDGPKNTKYLYYALKSQQQRLFKLRSGACMPNIKKKDLGDFELEFDFNEVIQNNIVNILDECNKIIDNYHLELELLDELIKARFVEMFGEPRSNLFGFDKMMLKDTCKVITGNTPSKAIAEYYGDYVEWIKTDNIVSGLLNPTRAAEFLSEKGVEVGKTVDKNSILMACIAGSIASIGRICVTDRTVAFNQQINAIVPQKYNILFLYVLLKISKDYLTEDINMALKGILSKSKLEKKQFIVPPIELQNKFSDFVRQVDKSKFVRFFIPIL